MTTPSLFATGYSASSLRSAPKKLDGSPITVRRDFSVAVGTATSTNVGLIPFNKGAKVIMSASAVYVNDVDTATSATCTLGWLYDSSSFTDDPDGFATTSTTPQTGGTINFTAATGYAFEAQGDGWIVLQTGGETVEVAYAGYVEATITYGV